MPVITWVNLIGREEARLTLKGWEFYKRCMVTGLGGLSTTRIRQAVQALANLNIYIGSSFAVFDPGIPTAKLEDITPKAEAPDTIQLDLVYRERANRPDNPGFGILQLGCSLQQITTNKDVNGNGLQIVYSGDGSKVTQDGQQITGWQTQEGTASVLRPQGTLHFTRQESSSPGVNQRLYVGSVNAAGWLADPSAAARTWLCTEISGQTKDGKVYEVTYQFQYRDPNWDEAVAWIDTGTGKPPSDYLSQNGLKTFVMYPTQNFNALALV